MIQPACEICEDRGMIAGHYCLCSIGELKKAMEECPDCCGRGLIAIGRAVQYCLCPKGRRLKAEWMAHPADLRELEERHHPTLPDPRPKTKTG